MALDSRAAAAMVIGDVLAGKSLSQALPSRTVMVGQRDRGLLQHLSYGALRYQPRLAALLEPLLNKPMRQKDNDILGLLLCGLYQLEYTRIPDHAAVAGTVNAVAALNKPWARGMVNAVLRRFLRERSRLVAGLDEAAAASQPPWLYHKLLQQWPRAAAQMIEASNGQPPMTLRVNARQLSRDSYLATLAAAAIEASAGSLCAQSVYLKQAVDVARLPGFAEGQVSVQDEAAQMAAILLQAAPGERVLDACAAPGGKACHILELQPDLAELVAMDIDRERLNRVAENLQRLGLQAALVAGDASASGLEPASFDRILVDAPCSGSGVIRRHPDIKLLRRETDIAQMADRQLAILRGLWPLLKPGGRLLYVTCSVLQEENCRVVQRFLDLCPAASPIPLVMDRGETSGHGYQLLPCPDGPDGLYYALLDRRA